MSGDGRPGAPGPDGRAPDADDQRWLEDTATLAQAEAARQIRRRRRAATLAFTALVVALGVCLLAATLPMLLARG
ncbi:hypothetical protein ACFUMH_12750 [Cellulomonas sp. NPDC057328]|uniref:hypothetical protein n=1 Tax=Cellulomonas sp. NPDC057328 TaxID=3346101 RepID=UPI00363F5817